VINSNSDLIDAEAGRTRANFAAEYSTSSAYAVGAFCTHAGILYQCNTAIGSGGEAWTAAHWTQISAGDAIVANNQAIATLNSKVPEMRSGIAEYTGLKGGGFADRVLVDITFSTPMPNTSYDVFATVAGAYGDFPYITCTPDNQNNTVNGTKIILINTSGSTTGVNGQIYWFVVARH
jgi:hypothetical protein